MIVFAICITFFLGFIAGWLFRESYIETKKNNSNKKERLANYKDRNIAKIFYENDVERIRALNHLSANEGIFMRILQNQFSSQNIVMKDKRFYITDKDFYPIAVFEYHEGQQQLRMTGNEDGLKVFFYKSMLSSEAIAEDKKFILWGISHD